MTTLDIGREGGVACVTLNRPDKRNAIDDATRDALAVVFAELDADAAVRVAILTGAGSAFCAGVDLATPGNVAAQSAAIATPIVTRPRLSAPLESFSKPVIAALNGVAVGGGLELALACDIRIAAIGARFGLPEVRIGSLPGSGGTQRLAGAVGRSLAAQMLFTGEMITAEQALAAGLVSEVLAAEALMERAYALARTIAANAPLSLIAIKKAFRAATDQPLAAGFELERALYGALALSEDRSEGRAAFREKRKPEFKGR
ncbi:MAG: enoyl-CoA hydratase/isomerase family protein [Hyphomicrobiales bacterium]|nr:enoyl-CoA hydratase/isomerase family protein [Hyphomicrobiales bacterium]